MKKSALIIGTAALMSFAPAVQDAGKDLCEAYIPMTEGTTLTYEDYDGKDKLQGSQKMTVTKVEEVGNAIVVSVHTLIEGKKEEDKMEQDFTYTCEDGVFKMNMESFADPSMQESMKDMEIQITQENLEFPSNMEVGQSLPDGKMTMEVFSSGMKVMTMNVEIVNRKVEAAETIETAAGSFPCIKISFTTKTKMGFMNSEINVKEWMSPNVGVVRSESYKGDKLESYRILTGIEHP